MLDALRTNNALLKLDLYCRGVRLDDTCFVEEDGGRKILRTRAGLGSGLELVLPGGPGGLWTNVPVTERFVERSPYTLHRVKGRYLLRWSGADVAQVQLSPRPRWYDHATATCGATTACASWASTGCRSASRSSTARSSGRSAPASTPSMGWTTTWRRSVTAPA